MVPAATSYMSASARSTVPRGAGGRHGAPTTATRRCPPIRWPSPPTLPSAPSGAPPILRRMMASAASCRNDCSHYRRAVRVARGPVNPGAPLPQGAGTVPSSPRSALRPVAGRASVAARVGRYAGGPPTGTGAGASRSMAPVRGRRISALSGGFCTAPLCLLAPDLLVGGHGNPLPTRDVRYPPYVGITRIDVTCVAVSHRVQVFLPQQIDEIRTVCLVHRERERRHAAMLRVQSS